MSESKPPIESMLPESVVPDAAPEALLDQAVEAVAARQAAAYEGLSRWMDNFAAKRAGELAMSHAVEPAVITIKIYPKADKWAAAALNGRSTGPYLRPKDDIERRHALKAYDMVRELGVVRATLAVAENNVYKLDPDTGESRFGRQQDGDSHFQPVDVALDNSILRFERKHRSAQKHKEKLLERLNPHAPSVKNIYAQAGKDDLSSLSWVESINGQPVEKHVSHKDEEGHYVIEATDEHGETTHEHQTEEQFDAYLKSKESSLSDFSMSITNN